MLRLSVPQPVAADSARGAGLFETLACVQCHSINGKGGTVAPDLGRRIDRDFTPASLAATMWNHAPAMWAAMRDRNVQAGDLNDQGGRRSVCLLLLGAFFRQTGRRRRGKRLFSVKHCADCHGLTDGEIPAAKPVSQWESIGHPMALVDAMWNHAATMREEFARRKLAWPALTAQELADMLVYLRNLPAERAAPAGLEISSGGNGASLFESKGCASCHTGKLDLGSRLRNKTLTGIAVEMWNHAPRMAPNPPQLSLEEMRDLVSYLWAGEFFKDSATPRRAGACSHRNIAPLVTTMPPAALPISPPPPIVYRGQHGFRAMASWPADARSDAGERHPMAPFRRERDVRSDRVSGFEEWRKVECPRCDSSCRPCICLSRPKWPEVIVDLTRITTATTPCPASETSQF